MKSKIEAYIEAENGYTLIETLVAMTVFVAVLIPLISAIGSLTVDGRADRTYTALAIGQSELALVLESKDFHDRTMTDIKGMRLERRVSIVGRLVDITIKVSGIARPEQVPLVLHKSLLIDE